MSLPWSKPSTLALSSAGIALSMQGKKPQLLTDGSFQWKNVNQLAEVLGQHKNSLINQQVRIILSNVFVRYLVLPWQNNIYTQADWQAVAKHAFRKQFGSVANDWLVSVSLAKHGQTVLAAAIDNNLYTQLQASAKQHKFNICAIDPLLMTLLNQNPTNTWALIAEPQRLALCQKLNEEWQQVVVDSPPTGQEYRHAEQLIQRCLLPLEASTQPNKIATYVSAALNKTWQDNIGSRQKLMTQLSGAEAHAVWMAGLPYNQVQKTQLGFTAKPQTKTSWWDWILMLGALVLSAFLWLSYQQAQAKINQLQEQVEAGFNTQPNADINPAQRDQLKLAQQTQQQLNLPWMQMLTALEVIKKANPDIDLLNISPNSSRAEIKLNGEAKNFADITHLLDSLRTNAAFSDATLVSQHLEQDADKPKSEVIYVFEINIGWHI